MTETTFDSHLTAHTFYGWVQIQLQPSLLFIIQDVSAEVHRFIKSSCTWQLLNPVWQDECYLAFSFQGSSCQSRCCGRWTCMAGCTAFPQLASAGSVQTTRYSSWNASLRGKGTAGASAVTTMFTSTLYPVRCPFVIERRPMKTRSAQPVYCYTCNVDSCMSSSVIKPCLCVFFRGGTQWTALLTHCCPLTVGHGAMWLEWIPNRSTASSCPLAAGSGKETGMWTIAMEEIPARLGWEEHGDLEVHFFVFISKSLSL